MHTLTEARLHAEILFTDTDGKRSVFRTERVAEHAEAAAHAKPHCSGCRRSFESIDAMAEHHAGEGGKDQGNGPHLWALVNPTYSKHVNVAAGYNPGIALVRFDA